MFSIPLPRLACSHSPTFLRASQGSSAGAQRARARLRAQRRARRCTCVYGLYKDIASKAAAAKEFSTYARCLNWYDLAVAPCKEEQKAFEAAYYKS